MHKYHADNSNYLNYNHGKEYFALHMLSLHFLKLCIANYVFASVEQNTRRNTRLPYTSYIHHTYSYYDSTHTFSSNSTLPKKLYLFICTIYVNMMCI